MSTYQLKLNQIVDYPRRRISRQFIRTLMEDRSIRMGGCSGFFYFAILCSFASTQNTTARIEKKSFKVSAGEYIFCENELMSWFRMKNRDEAFAMLEDFRGYDLIDYYPLSHSGYYKYKILHWSMCNTAYEQCPPCEVESDFFFIPMSVLYETFYYREFSEADIIFDLWMNANHGELEDQKTEGMPAVYVRNDDGKLIMKYDSLTLQWDLPVTRIQAAFLKFEELGYITVLTPHYPIGGLLICLRGFLASAFHVSDLMIDKDDWPLSLRLRIKLPETLNSTGSLHNRISMPIELAEIAPISHYEAIVQKVEDILYLQGVKCSRCPKTSYNIDSIPVELTPDYYFNRNKSKNNIIGKQMILSVFCADKTKLLSFGLTILEEVEQNGNID